MLLSMTFIDTLIAGEKDNCKLELIITLTEH